MTKKMRIVFSGSIEEIELKEKRAHINLKILQSNSRIEEEVYQKQLAIINHLLKKSMNKREARDNNILPPPAPSKYPICPKCKKELNTLINEHYIHSYTLYELLNFPIIPCDYIEFHSPACYAPSPANCGYESKKEAI